MRVVRVLIPLRMVSVHTPQCEQLHVPRCSSEYSVEPIEDRLTECLSEKSHSQNEVPTPALLECKECFFLMGFCTLHGSHPVCWAFMTPCFLRAGSEQASDGNCMAWHCHSPHPADTPLLPRYPHTSHTPSHTSPYSPIHLPVHPWFNITDGL